MNSLVAADMPLPHPLGVRRGCSGEYKLLKLRDCPLMTCKVLDTPEKIHELWNMHIPSAPWYRDEQETFVVFFLNTLRFMVGFSMISIGTMDTILVHPREVFRSAIVAGAAAIILAHNHPSGDPTPSEADIKATRDLMRAGAAYQNRGSRSCDHRDGDLRTDQSLVLVARAWVSFLGFSSAPRCTLETKRRNVF